MSHTVEKKAQQARKANDFLADERLLRQTGMLFDGFWREGELAMLFGPPGVGKSLAAVQIADAIARGRPLDGFCMPAARRRVLYVDLELSGEQFGRRYTDRQDGKALRAYGFSENLFRDHPPEGAELIQWLREQVKEVGARAVVIDSLTAMKQTHYGTKETLALMKDLKKLLGELDISILVLMGSAASGRGRFISESDLGKSQVLCGTADSVFAIGRELKNDNEMFMVQTRSRNAPIQWKLNNAPGCSIARLESGLLGFVFDNRFGPRVSEERRHMICRVRNLRDLGLAFADIAAAFKISPSMAWRLNKSWVPAMERFEDEKQFATDEIFHVPGTLDDQSPEQQNPQPDADPGSAGRPGNEPSEPGAKRRTIYDLEEGLDDSGRDIYIEKRISSTGRIQVFYRFEDNGLLKRWTRLPYGWSIGQLKDPPYLDSG